MTEQVAETTDTTEDTEAARVPDATSEDQDTEEDNHESVNSDDGDQDPDTFPREYVEQLRDENAKYRQRAQRADELAHRLHRALVEATGRLQDPSDLEFDPEHLDDSEALTAALDELLARKPHLAARRPSGSIGQGAQPTGNTAVDLAGILRAGAN